MILYGLVQNVNLRNQLTDEISTFMTGTRDLHCHLPSAFCPLLLISSLKETVIIRQKVKVTRLHGVMSKTASFYICPLLFN